MTTPRDRPEWRVDFGNEQVHYAGDRRACERFIRDHGDGFMRLERRDPETGDWFRVRVRTT